MTREKWKSRIKSLCKSAGTYDKKLDPMIETLARICSRLDDMYEQFDAEGREYIEEHEGKNGALLKDSNPLVIRIEKHEELAKGFLNDLGLSAKAAKTNGKENANKGKSKLALLMESLED